MSEEFGTLGADDRDVTTLLGVTRPVIGTILVVCEKKGIGSVAGTPWTGTTRTE